MMQYWISDGTRQFGPYLIDQLLDQGLEPHWLVWTEGMDEWTRADSLPDIRPLFQPPRQANQDIPRSVPPILDQPAQPPEEALPPPQPVDYAGPTPTPVTPIYYSPQAQPQTMAITSLICGLAGFVMGFFPVSVVAIVTGHLALARIRRGEESGRGMAMTGLIVGYVTIGLTILAIAGFCAIPCLFAISFPS